MGAPAPGAAPPLCAAFGVAKLPASPRASGNMVAAEATLRRRVC